MSKNPQITKVADAGARYGMHPSWRNFNSEISYFAFEPDTEEVKRLKEYESETYKVCPLALGAKKERVQFNLCSHRGCSSILTPDIDSLWFGNYRSEEGSIEQTIEVEMTTLDDFAKENKIQFDFLKADVEGAELDLFSGAKEQLKSILGIRCEVHFERTFHKQPLFDEIFKFLINANYYLLNLGYSGRGIPRHRLYRTAEPLSLDIKPYGVISGCDAVFMKKIDFSDSKNIQDQYRALKYAAFCHLNGATDVALKTLEESFVQKFSSEVFNSCLYKFLRLEIIKYLGQYRCNPNNPDWELAKDCANLIFNIELPSGNGYWELIRTL